MHSNAVQAFGILVGAVVAVACASPESTESPPGSATKIPVQQVDILLSELHSGVTERRREVIRSEKEWNAFWAQVYAPVRPQPAVPAVNFADSVVVVASMGERSSGGYVIEVEDVERTASGVRVVVRETSPGASCMSTAALSQPVVAVRIPRTAGEVVFEERKSVRECS